MGRIMTLLIQKEKMGVSEFSSSNSSDYMNMISASDFYKPERGKSYSLFYSQLNAFEQIVEKRIHYLDSLCSLDDNWIMGKSEKPNLDVISTAKNILIEFVTYLKRSFIARENIKKLSFNENMFSLTSVYDYFPKIPKLIMGPGPSGGITLEFHADQSTALFVTLMNEMTNMDLEVKIKDTYSDIVISKTRYRDLIDDYKALTWN